MEKRHEMEFLDRLVLLQDQAEMNRLKSSGRVSVEDGYIGMLPYLFDWLCSYEITVLPENSPQFLRSGDAYGSFRRYLGMRGVDYTGKYLYVTRFLKEMGMPYVSERDGRGLQFLIRLDKRV